MLISTCSGIAARPSRPGPVATCQWLRQVLEGGALQNCTTRAMGQKFQIKIIPNQCHAYLHAYYIHVQKPLFCLCECSGVLKLPFKYQLWKECYVQLDHIAPILLQFPGKYYLPTAQFQTFFFRIYQCLLPYVVQYSGPCTVYTCLGNIILFAEY